MFSINPNMVYFNISSNKIIPLQFLRLIFQKNVAFSTGWEGLIPGQILELFEQLCISCLLWFYGLLHKEQAMCYFDTQVVGRTCTFIALTTKVDLVQLLVEVQPNTGAGMLSDGEILQLICEQFSDWALLSYW